MTDSGNAEFIDLNRHYERAITAHRMRSGEPRTETERAAARIADAEEVRRDGGK